MRRRIGIALVGIVVASLALAGVGAILLASVADRADDEKDLREQTDALRGVFSELTLSRSTDGETQRQQLERFSATMSLEGVGVILVPDNGALIGSFPPGVTIDDLDVPVLRSGEIDSGTVDGLIFAAGGIDNEGATSTLIVLTREPSPIIAPAFRWFLPAGFITLLLALLVTMRLSRSLIAPIRDTSATAKRIADGDLSARADSPGTRGDELDELVQSVNAMAGNLERSRALERQFLLSVSHDLRTPLTSIRGYAEALADGAIDDPVAAGAVIETESKRLERLVGDLLLLARLEGTGFAFDIGAHDVVPRVRELIDAATPEARARGVALRVDAPAEPLVARVDLDRFAQVVANLLDNALRFARSEVRVSLAFVEGSIELAVADDGTGISDADLPHVFERLYVAQRQPEVRESGSGLGLAIVRELVGGMHGSVEARRSPLGGAEFIVRLVPATG